MINVLRLNGKSTHKGLSDILSVILLIAFTLSTIFLVGTWVTGMVNSGTDKTGKALAKTIDCNYADFQLQPDSFTYTNGSNSTFSFAILNKGKASLYNFTILAENPEEINELTISNQLTSANPLKTGDIIQLTGFGKINGSQFKIFSRVCPQVYIEPTI